MLAIQLILLEFGWFATSLSTRKSGRAFGHFLVPSPRQVRFAWSVTKSDSNSQLGLYGL